MEFHEKIQKLMDEKGWSQVYLAQKISVTSQRLSLWLKGTGVPKPYQLLKIARTFGVDAEYLLDDELGETPVAQQGSEGRREGATFHQKLQEICQSRGLGRGNLATMAGVSRSTVDNWFNGRTEPTLKAAWAIAKGVGVPLDWLADDSQSEALPRGEGGGEEDMVVTFYRSLGLTQGQALRGLALMVMPTPEEAARMRGESNGKQSP